MLRCGKCEAKGFITVEEGEFHCHLCGFVWYLERSAGRVRGRCPGTGVKDAERRHARPAAGEGTWPGAE